MMLVGARGSFCAGHSLPNHIAVHGHSYEVWAYAENVDAEEWQMKVKGACWPIDHSMLNTTIDPPTMENIARYIAKETGAKFVRIIRPVEGLSAEFTND